MKVFNGGDNLFRIWNLDVAGFTFKVEKKNDTMELVQKFERRSHKVVDGCYVFL